MSLTQGDELLSGGGVGLEGGVVGAAGELVEAIVAELVVAGDPHMGGLAGDGEAIRQVGDGVVPELEIVEESLAFFVHGNTFPGHGRHLRLRKCYLCPATKCYRCLATNLLPMSRNGSFDFHRPTHPASGCLAMELIPCEKRFLHVGLDEVGKDPSDAVLRRWRRPIGYLGFIPWLAIAFLRLSPCAVMADQRIA